ncbi:aldo/keto reductase [Pseudomonas syringae]|uniref:aldo/keto reductase n=1 Tax=Pseudomonas syringae TaxID=317 RepID=UPI0024921B6B|nr:aldo/keto reductase [Pseudomonas syringae]
MLAAVILQAGTSPLRRQQRPAVPSWAWFQSIYNLSNRAIEQEVIPACRHLGLGVVPWNPLGGGLLGGAVQKIIEGRRAKPKVATQIERLRPQSEKYEALCAELGESSADVALAWLLHQPAVTAPVIGPRTVAQLKENLKALTVDLSASTLERLDEIWPTQGEAPQAYAW